MNRKSTRPIPEAIIQLQRQLDQFRSTQPIRTKLPGSLCRAAVELAGNTAYIPSRIRCGLTMTVRKARNSKPRSMPWRRDCGGDI